MATKAGRVELKDIKAGKTFWKAVIDPVTGKRSASAIQIIDGIQLGRFKRPDQTPVAMWWYGQRSLDPQTGQTLKARVVCDPMWSPRNEQDEPIFDKLFVNRAAVMRWIKRYESNRITTLCEDRRVFDCGDRPLRTVARTQPDQLDLEQLPDHRFQHAEIAFAKHYGVPRSAKLNETPHG
jgi:hypothetical protein